MPLAMIRIGERAKVVSITGTDAVRRHLGSLGFISGVVVSIVQVLNGNMIIGIHDSRIAVGAEVSRRVLVEVVK